MPDRPPLPRPVLLLLFGISGAAALSYEVVWTRALSVVLGSTTYALSSMLATFMLGLAVGGVIGGRVADRRGRALVWLGAAELGIGALGIASHLVIERLPALYLSMYQATHVAPPIFFAFQIGLCALVMLGPTVLMGMTFPLATRAAGGGPDELGRVVGTVYGANTLGSVVGSLAAGFVLVPWLGLRGATLAAAALNLSVAAVALWWGGGSRDRRLLALALLYVPLGAAALSVERAWTTVNFYSAGRYGDAPYGLVAARERASTRKLYERDGADAYVAAYRTADDHLLVQVGGKTEGTAAPDVANTLLLAYLPAAAHRSAERVLVVGLGAGETLAAARRVAADVALVEISSGVLDAVRLHGRPGLLDGIAVHRDDARNLLMRSTEQWDVITSEPSYPTDFGVSNLFSVEFYRLAAARLRSGGVFCQWLPYYMLGNEDVAMMLKTFGSVFPHASLWKVPSSLDLLILGSGTSFQRSPAEILERVAAMSPGEPLGIVLSRSPEQIAAVVRDAAVALNTDDRPRLEFNVARNFLAGRPRK